MISIGFSTIVLETNMVKLKINTTYLFTGIIIACIYMFLSFYALSAFEAIEKIFLWC